MYEERRTERPPLGSYLIDFGVDLNALKVSLKKISERVDAYVRRESCDIEDGVRLREEIRTFESQVNTTLTSYRDGSLIARSNVDFGELLRKYIKQMYMKLDGVET